MLAVLGSVALVSFFHHFIIRRNYNHTEEYMQQHDGGDRAEYLQEIEHSDPSFYVPPVNGTSYSSITDSNISAN
jgi:hypothetical protein